jgi:hypothetical protein
MKAERRIGKRKTVSPLSISTIADLDTLTRLSRGGIIVDASASGLLIRVRRDDLLPQILRATLNLDSLIETDISIHIHAMDLEITGTIKRTKLVGKKSFELGVDFSEEAPLYWRECLVDLLPSPEEMDELEK